MREHWKPAFATATIRSDQLSIELENVTGFSLIFPPGFPLDYTKAVGETPAVTLEEISGLSGTQMAVPFGALPQSDGSMNASFIKGDEGEWIELEKPRNGLRKKHGLQGPIDDAFMDSFIFVRPTGQPASEKAGAWAKAELERAIEHWRRHYRGDARVKDDTAITEEDIKSANLILWGDPSSNSLIAKTAPQLPISWTGSEIKAGEKSFPTADHALICIYPNPLNPERYLVLNSSFTFRDYDYLNNARQTPKLPDWAVIDLNQLPNARTPGKIAAADFFGEKWELKDSK